MDFLPGLDGAIAPVLSYKQMSQVVSLPKNRHARVYSSNRGFKVIAHVSIGVKDVERSKRFYDQALQPLGYRCIRTARSGAGYGYGADIIFFWVMAAERPVLPDDESGLHVCFAAPSVGAVDDFHAAALNAGGRDNGATGPRPIYGDDYYAAFVIDPDGYRIEAYFGPGEK